MLVLGRAINSARAFWRRKGPKSLTERLIVYGSFLIVPAFIVYALAFEPEPDVYPDSPDVTYDNQTRGFVRVFVNGYYQASLDSGESKIDRYFYCPRGCLVEATDRGGRVLFSRFVTRRELDADGARIVIDISY